MNTMNTNRQQTAHSVSQFHQFLSTQNQHDIWKANNTQMSNLAEKKFDLMQQLLDNLKKSQKFTSSKKYQQKNQQKSFSEQWQSKQKPNYHLKYSYFFRQSNFYFACNIIIFILKIILFWFISVYRTFSFPDYKYGFLFCLSMQILVITLKSGYAIYFKLKKNKLYPFQIQFLDWFQIYGGNIYLFIYSICGLSIKDFISKDNLHFIIFDIIALVIMISHINVIQSDIKAKFFSAKFKCYFKLINLFTTLLLIVHSFAVLMFFTTNFDNETHYLDHIQDHQTFQWLDYYIYSFYFSGTTVLTVGYGDILPKNFIQIAIVLVMQILGVLITVILNGQVGNILSSLRQQQEVLQNDLCILQRIKTSFTLPFQTTQKIRKYLFDNMVVDQKKLFDEQTVLLQKISPDLRDQAYLTNHINLVKQNGFLMMNFSSKAQLLIANKLQRMIYAPNEKIRQSYGNQKLFFLKQGQINFYISPKQRSNQSLRKVIKTIQRNHNNNEPSYCFGYTYLISQRFPRLKVATTKFSTCYQINKNDFLSAISRDKLDFQKYHELKSMFTTQSIPQKHQVEQFYSEKQHYICKIQTVLAEYLKEKTKSKRRNFLRKHNRGNFINGGKNIDVVVDEGSQSQFESQKISDNISIGQNETINIKNSSILSTKKLKKSIDFASCLNTLERNQKYKDMKSSQIASKNIIVQRKYNKKYCKQAYQKLKVQQWAQNFRQLDLKEQSGANFINYHTNFNLEIVMKRINYYSKILAIFTNIVQEGPRPRRISFLDKQQQNSRTPPITQKQKTSSLKLQTGKKNKRSTNQIIKLIF